MTIKQPWWKPAWVWLRNWKREPIGRTKRWAMRTCQQADAKLDWTDIRALGNSRLVATSAAWLVIVPMLAKLIGPFAGEYVIELGGHVRTLHVGLPFTWQLFYLMAVMFLLGQFAYRWRCPEVVRRYATFGDFRADHPGRPIALFRYLRSAVELQHPHVYANLGRVWDIRGMQNYRLPPTDVFKNDMLRCIEQITQTEHYLQHESQLATVFDALLEGEKRANRGAFWIACLLFFAGLALLFYFMLENAIAVVRATF